MKRLSWLIICGCLYLTAHAGFVENFKNYNESNPPAPTWTPMSGDWSIVKGEYVQKSDEFDMGSVYQTPLTTSDVFYYETTFRSLGNFKGGGLFFNMKNKNSKANSMMVRLDEDVLLWGYFDSKGDFQPTNTLSLKPSAVGVRLAVAGNNKTRLYHIYVNGVRVVANQTMNYSGGYIGLQSSGGAHAFSKAELRAPKADEMIGLSTQAPLASPKWVAVSSDNLLFTISNNNPPIRIWNTSGKLLAAFGKNLKDPVRIRLARSIIYVWDAGDNTLRTYAFIKNQPKDKSDKNLIEALIDRGKEPPYTILRSTADKFPTAIVDFDVVQNAQGNILCAALTADGKVFFRTDPKGKWSNPVDVKEALKPTAIALQGNRMAVADSDNAKARYFIHLYELNAKTIEPKFIKSISAWHDPKQVALLPGGRIVHRGGLDYYGSTGCIRLIDENGVRIAHTGLFSFGALSREGAFTVDANGNIYATDANLNSIIKILPDLREPDPVVTPTDKGVRIRWRSTINKEPAYLKYGTNPDGAKWRGVPAVWVNGAWQADIQTQPNTRYFYKFYPVLPMIPKRLESNVKSFVSPAEKGKSQAVELRVLSVIYLKADLDGKKADIAEYGDKVLEKVSMEYEKARLFYWRNSRCKLHVDLKDYIVLKDKEAIVKAGWLSPSDVKQDIAGELKAMGKSLDDYDSIVATWAEPNFNPNQTDELGAVGGGGLTPYGYSCFGINGKLAWLFVHEFNHQVDAFYNASGMVEYWLNHPEATIHPGKYGGHFDCNAFLMRKWRSDQYMTLRQGRVILFNDFDADGLPDNDPSLPIDEKRLNSDPKKTDTDRDGLKDMDEFTAGIFTSCNPAEPDTDADGLLDGEDDLPLYNFNPKIPYASVQSKALPLVYMRQDADVIDPREETLRELWLKGSFSMMWNANELTLILNMDGDFDVEFDIDAADNGWFYFDDNLEIRCSTRNASAQPIGVNCNVQESNGMKTLTIRAPAKLFNKEALTAGMKMGIRIYLKKPAGNLHIFEPWTMPMVELAKP